MEESTWTLRKLPWRRIAISITYPIVGLDYWNNIIVDVVSDTVADSTIVVVVIVMMM